MTISTRAPAWRYHATHGGRIFQTEAELDALPPDWHDHPNKCQPAKIARVTDEVPVAPDEPAIVDPAPSPAVEAEPSSPAPPRRKNRLSQSKEIG